MKTIILTSTSKFLILSVVFLILILILYLFWLKYRKKQVAKLLNNLSEKYNFTLKTGEKVDFILEKKDLTILVKLIFVPGNSTITVNSKDTWCLRYGGSNKYQYPKMRYLDHLKPFLNYQNDFERKVVIVYPGTNKIQRYLNESEIAILEYKDLVYDYKIITFEDLEKHFQDLL